MNDTLQLPIDVTQIQELIPHRYPFLLVDKVLELDVEAKHIVAQKNVSINEPYFQGHFPGRPIMPGVLIIEALAQAGGVMTQLSLGRDAQSKLFYMVKVENARFNKQVVPGDVLLVESEHDTYIPHATIMSYRAAFQHTHSLTHRIIDDADHALSSERAQEAYTDILVRWITEMVVGERSNRLVVG